MDIAVCMAFDKSGTVAVALSGGVMACLATMTTAGIGAIIAKAAKYSNAISFGISPS